MESNLTKTSKQILQNEIKPKTIEDIINQGKIEGLLKKKDDRIEVEWSERNNFFKRMGLIKIESDTSEEFTYESAFLFYRNDDLGIFLTALNENIQKEAVIYLFKQNEKNDIFPVEFITTKVIKGENYNFHIVEEEKGFDDFEPINLFFCFYDENIDEDNQTMFCGGISLPDTVKNDDSVDSYKHVIQTHSFQSGCLIYEVYEKDVYVIYGMNTKTKQKNVRGEPKNNAVKFKRADFEKIKEEYKIFIHSPEDKRILYEVIEK